MFRVLIENKFCKGGVHSLGSDMLPRRQLIGEYALLCVESVGNVHFGHCM